MNNSPPRHKVAVLTLGCAKNLVDSEHICSILEAGGAEVCHTPEGAAVVIVNTCGFIRTAKEESIDVILEMGWQKKEGGLKTLIVTGCLSQRYGAGLERLLPEADAFVGVDPQSAARLALKALGLDSRPLPSHVMLRSRRLTPRAWSYLRISHGCDNRCAYCAIPLIRGRLRSRPMQELLDEARLLAESGVKELNVIAQDIAAYGRDVGGEPRLHELLRALCGTDGLEWIRLLYAHPAHLYDELVEVIAEERKICPYLDIPLQHANDRVLGRMGRGITRAEIEHLIAGLRDAIPGLALRTTFMTGFPGETDAEFAELLQFVNAMRFDRMGCFIYSQEEGTRAAELPGQVAEAVAEERRDALMTAQQEIAFGLAAARIGERTTVLVEDAEVGQGGAYPARSCHEAPDVDPYILVKSKLPLPAGAFVEVEIVGATGYDCIARVTAEDGHAQQET